MNFKSVFGFLAAVFFSELAQGATIDSVSPAYGSAGETIILQGSGFVFPPGTNIVKFGSYYAPFTHAGLTTSLQVTVPSAPVGSVVRISVSTDGVNYTENPTDFTIIGSGPYVASLNPNSGGVGTSVSITGKHFVGVSQQKDIRVWFNGIPATITSYADLLLKATAPAGVTTGPITVGRVGAGTNTSTVLFYVTPAVTNFSPAFGRAGTNVTIRGINLGGATNVYFNGLSAPIISNTMNEVVTIVPANATT
ncbi:MAG TPA: IPT/TIG domain-containing protein, partial [Candidatus Paceibacterota bacterium]|nr:IPT/TIG domain-containing protein [Candidatus Paceibacterota bacterium]